MSEEELDEARAKEAYRLVLDRLDGAKVGVHQMAELAARLAREGWKPEDPLLKEARTLCGDWLASEYKSDPSTWFAGENDDTGTMRLALAALKRGIELAKAEASA
jgi:hypothetical protein